MINKGLIAQRNPSMGALRAIIGRFVQDDGQPRSSGNVFALSGEVSSRSWKPYESDDHKKALAALGPGVERDFRIAEGV